jgi:hypothetical protein
MANQDETTTMNLQNSITVNGVTYARGMKVVVPKDQADNLSEIDFRAQEQKNNLVRQPQEYMGQAGTNPLTGRPWSNRE